MGMEVVQKFVSNLTTARWPANATDRIAKLYPPTALEFKRVPKAAMDAMVGDIRVVCGTLENARRLVKGRQRQTTHDATDVWAYYTDMSAASGDGGVHHCTTLN